MEFPITNDKLQAYVDDYADSIEKEVSYVIAYDVEKGYIDLDPKKIVNALTTILQQRVRHCSSDRTISIKFGELSPGRLYYPRHLLDREIAKFVDPFVTAYFPVAVYRFQLYDTPTTCALYLDFTLPEPSGQTSNP